MAQKWPNKKAQQKDQKFDKQHHIIEGSWQDKAIDKAAAKRGKRGR